LVLNQMYWLLPLVVASRPTSMNRLPGTNIARASSTTPGPHDAYDSIDE